VAGDPSPAARGAPPDGNPGPSGSDGEPSTLAVREAQLLDRIGRGALRGAETGEGVETGETGEGRPLLPPPYVALRKLGEGGMGEVWEGRHTQLDKPVAIKLLQTKRDGDAETRTRFARESRTAAAVHHENVVEISDIGETVDGRPYQIMELLEGPTLSELIADEGALPWARVSAILTQLTDALAYAHRIGVIHRDLKPSNVIVIGRRHEGDYCKLIDFGLAKRLDLGEEAGELTHTGQVFGSPAYMSPEQCRGEPADPRTDIYALGCVAFFLACGRKPFEDKTLGGLIYQQQFGSVDPELFLHDSPHREVIGALIRRAMDKDPAARFASMEAFGAAVTAVSGGAPAEAGGLAPVDPSSVPDKGERRWWPLVGALISVAGLGLGLTLGLGGLFDEERSPAIPSVDQGPRDGSPASGAETPSTESRDPDMGEPLGRVSGPAGLSSEQPVGLGPASGPEGLSSEQPAAEGMKAPVKAAQPSAPVTTKGAAEPGARRSPKPSPKPSKPAESEPGESPRDPSSSGGAYIPSKPTDPFAPGHGA